MTNRNTSVFVYPKLHKSGLGNLLWMWAKSYCWAMDHDLPMLAPNWIHVDWKRHLLMDADKRNYLGYFVSDGYIDGWKKKLILLTHKQLAPVRNIQEVSLGVMIFDQLGDFTPLIGRHELVAEEFFRIVRPEHIPAYSMYPERFIALHVRMGDFETVDEQTIKAGKTNVRLPLEWYLDSLKTCRKALGQEFPAVIFSDGTEDELKLFLNEENVQLARGESAMADLIALSRASLLIASRSSFSLWAAYIGQMPVIYYTGARPWHEPVVHPEAGGEWEIERLSGTPLPGSFLNKLGF